MTAHGRPRASGLWGASRRPPELLCGVPSMVRDHGILFACFLSTASKHVFAPTHGGGGSLTCRRVELAQHVSKLESAVHVREGVSDHLAGVGGSSTAKPCGRWDISPLTCTFAATGARVAALVSLRSAKRPR